MTKMVLGLDVLGSSSYVTAITDGNVNSIYIRQKDHWFQAYQWQGKELTAFCTAGDKIVAIEVDGLVNVFVEGNHRIIKGPDIGWVYAVSHLSNNSVLLGGINGALVFIDLVKQQARKLTLASYNIPKPGRTIFNIVRIQGETYLLGYMGLLAKFTNQHIETVIPLEVQESKFHIHYLVQNKDTFILSGLYGVNPIVGILQDNNIRFINTPELLDFAPPLYNVEEALYLLTNNIWLQNNDLWIPQLSTNIEGSFIAMSQQPNSLLAITDEGGVFFFTDNTWQQEKIF